MALNERIQILIEKFFGTVVVDLTKLTLQVLEGSDLDVAVDLRVMMSNSYVHIVLNLSVFAE